MALWPFRRRSDRKRSRSGAALSDVEGPPPRSRTEGVARAASKKKQRTEPTKLQRRARTYSFSPGRNDDLGIDRSRGSVERPVRQARGGNEDVAWERTPTLHHKRSGNHPARRKSSKRRKQDHDREAEIKAMSNFMPVRPATDAWAAGRPMKKDTRRVKTMGFGTQHENPASDVSLPLPGSIHSTLSSDSEFASYKVSTFDALAPRPTLRYAPGSRWMASRASVPAPSNSHKKDPVERVAIPRETLKAHKRIDDLADDLDASGLRELLERDDRMREKRRQHDQQRSARRLAREAEKHKELDADSRKSGTPPPENLERGVVGRELVGLGLDPASAVRTSSKHRASDESEAVPESDKALSKKPSDSFQPIDSVSQQPLEVREAQVAQEESAASSSNQPLQQEPAQPMENEEPIQDLPQNFKVAGLLRSKKSRSKSTLGSDKDKTISSQPSRIEEEEDGQRKGSVASSKARFSLTSFLRRGGKSKRNSGPSSFSNTSREEMLAVASAQAQAETVEPTRRDTQADPQAQKTQAAQAQAHALARLEGLDTTPSSSPTLTGNYLSRKPSSGAPKRTRSRFREDLPDFPLSPPDSRVQSPEADPPLPSLPEGRLHESGPQPIPIPSRRYDSPTSLEGMRHTSASTDRGYGAPSPEPHQSMSLASIDSEGSWLSGRAASRRASTIRDSVARTNRRRQAHSSDSPTNSTQEDLAITEDDYLSRLAPDRNSALNPGRRSGSGRPSSDEEEFAEEGDMTWGDVGARPQVVHVHKHDRQTMQSQEGLLNISSGDEGSDSPHSPASPISPVSPAGEEADLQRARSVNLGRGHARNFSAGSAKLLDLTPRASVDSRGASPKRRASMPLN